MILSDFIKWIKEKSIELLCLFLRYDLMHEFCRWIWYLDSPQQLIGAARNLFSSHIANRNSNRVLSMTRFSLRSAGRDTWKLFNHSPFLLEIALLLLWLRWRFLENIKQVCFTFHDPRLHVSNMHPRTPFTRWAGRSVLSLVRTAHRRRHFESMWKRGVWNWQPSGGAA
jgi:hypothetical protein